MAISPAHFSQSKEFQACMVRLMAAVDLIIILFGVGLAEIITKELVKYVARVREQEAEDMGRTLQLIPEMNKLINSKLERK